MLPKKLKNMNLFHQGVSFLGQVATVTLPTLARTIEDYRGGGMDGAVGVDMGQEPLELEWGCGGFMEEVLDQYGVTSASGVLLRFNGAYQRDDTGQTHAVEVVVNGRHGEIEPGEAKPGEDTEFNVKTRATYYKLSIDGRVKIEIDLLNFVFTVNGVDRLAEQRKALGLDSSDLGSLVSAPRLNVPGFGGIGF
jgi:hypothetical protein